MGLTREQIGQSAGKKLSAALASLPGTPALIGLDGFVDEIIAVVDKRIDKDHYEPVKTISDFGQKVLRAAGQSSNYEMLVKQTKLGGNGPIMANALASAGMGVSYVGNLGYPDLHPIFADFAKRAKVFSIAPPGHTDALEFEDGKLMLGKHETLAQVNWENMQQRVGKEVLKNLVVGAKLIGMTNWTMLAFMSDIWSKLQSEILDKAPANPNRFFFVDLADPEKRMRGDISSALGILSKFEGKSKVILGLNLKESSEIADVLGLKIAGDPEAAVEETARSIRAKLNISCVVIHPRTGAAAATADQTARIAGPFVQQPKISTGAGDHFNAGFCLGRVIGLSLEESLCTGVGTSGYYVRSAQSPTGQQLADFITKLPAPQA